MVLKSILCETVDCRLSSRACCCPAIYGTVVGLVIGVGGKGPNHNGRPIAINGRFSFWAGLAPTPIPANRPQPWSPPCRGGWACRPLQKAEFPACLSGGGQQNGFYRKVGQHLQVSLRVGSSALVAVLAFTLFCMVSAVVHSLHLPVFFH